MRVLERVHEALRQPLGRARVGTTVVALLLLGQHASAQRTPATPAEPLQRARLALQRGQYPEAETLLTPLASRARPNDATLELGLLLRYVGRRAEGDRWLDAVVSSRASSVADFVRVGRAAHALGEFRLANEAFQDASDRAPNDVALHLAWGRLFLDAHDPAEAAESFQAAIEHDPQSAAAYTGLAEALAVDAPPPALKAAQRAIELDPSYVPAHLVVAELYLDRAERDAARQALDRALAVNPMSLEARALRGAIAHLEDRLDDFQREAGEILTMNAMYGEVYRVAGDVAARNYRFQEASALTRRALELDPANSRAYADLGMHLLRTGDEAAARQSLERAFQMDPRDVVTYNLLNMLDTLDTFEAVRQGPVTFRFHPEEASVMREYAMPLTAEALGALSARYQFEPQGPILVEIFPKHDDFAVRNLGLPGMIGALGACFGHVVTMDSPRAREPGTFNWGATLWHELAHVITLQMSNNRLPRWLSEGISVYEEKRAAPEWGREMEVAFAQALQRDKILALKDLNAGFTDSETISLAYYEASLLVEHIVQTYGEPALMRLVRIYGEGVEGEDALTQALGVDLDALQTAFTAALEATFEPLVAALEPPPGIEAAMGDIGLAGALAEAHPGSYLAHVAHGRLLWKEGRLDQAIAALEKAAALVPMAAGSESPRAMIAQIASKQGDRPRAARELEALLQHDHTNVEAARQLVALLAEGLTGAPGPDRSRLIPALQKVVAVDPFDAAAHASLGKLLLERRDYARAIRELRGALASGPADRAAVHADLAEAYLGADQPDQAKRQTLAALEIAPSYERAQTLLLKLVESR